MTVAGRSGPSAFRFSRDALRSLIVANGNHPTTDKLIASLLGIDYKPELVPELHKIRAAAHEQTSADR